MANRIINEYIFIANIIYTYLRPLQV